MIANQQPGHAGYTVSDLTPVIGTAVHADADTLLSGAIASDLRELLERRGVLVFPEINLTDEHR